MNKIFFFLLIFIYCFNLRNIIQAENYDALTKKTEYLRELKQKYHNSLNEWNSEKNKLNNKIRLLESQNSSLNKLLKKNSEIQSELNSKIKDLKSKLSKTDKIKKNFLPILINSVSSIKTYITNNVPFKLNKRLSELETLKNKLYDKNLSLKKKIDNIIVYLQNEIEYTISNEIYEKEILLNNEHKLVHIIRIGVSLVYFKSLDNKTAGIMKLDNNKKFYWHIFKNTDYIESVIELYKQLKNNNEIKLINLPVYKP
jgi:DNA repair exonuclease SbcCD ATPase subunit